MKIMLNIELENCKDCPFVHNDENGKCCNLIYFGYIPTEGIRTDCPFRENKEVKTLQKKMANERYTVH